VDTDENIHRYIHIRLHPDLGYDAPNFAFFAWNFARVYYTQLFQSFMATPMIYPKSVACTCQKRQ